MTRKKGEIPWITIYILFTSVLRAKMKNKIRGMSDMTSVRRGTVGRNINTCHATRGFLAAVGPYPRPDCGEAQTPGGWAVQLMIEYLALFSIALYFLGGYFTRKRGWKNKRASSL